MPIVEPEVLMDGDHTIDACSIGHDRACCTPSSPSSTTSASSSRDAAQAEHGAAGLRAARQQAAIDEVAEATLALPAPQRARRRCRASSSSPAASRDEAATAHLDAMNRLGPQPWQLSFSYGRALQAAAQHAWAGSVENVTTAQRAFLHRARMNGLARDGRWSAELERAS